MNDGGVNWINESEKQDKLFTQEVSETLEMDNEELVKKDFQSFHEHTPNR
jgi:hypothetical protein